MKYEETVQNFFSKNALSFVLDQYKKQDYSYPCAVNRIRISLGILKEKSPDKKLNILEIGCGGGNFCATLAKLGHNVVGVDQSKEMISLAEKEIASHGEEISSKVKLVVGNFDDVELEENSFDVITALGVFEYLTDENSFLSKANKLLKPDGIFILDFRNRLFNMTSISHYTKKEIKDGNALELIEEIEELYGSIPKEKSAEFIEYLEMMLEETKKDVANETNNVEKEEEPKFEGIVEGNQHTPKQVTRFAQEHGFINPEYFGVHPHLFIPKLNKLLLPRVFNRLSDSLITFERLPISLIWSSKFIGVFSKKSK